MADAVTSRRRQSSRLQRRAPASIQINRSLEWNVAIPLLSPLASSPPPNRLFDQTAEIDSRQQATASGSDQKAVVVFRKWQHPAAPFFYDPAPSLPPFLRLDRS
ncbi:hypothetical protein Dimus_028689 [Dionaea muscipula]